MGGPVIFWLGKGFSGDFGWNGWRCKRIFEKKIAQAYSTMGFCTFMKTVEVTRHRSAGVQQSSLAIARDILKREGFVGINKGVNAVGIFLIYVKLCDK
jgi:hypothetical protein